MVRSPRSLPGLVVFLLSASLVAADPLQKSYQLRDGGQRREFIVAQDEMHRAQRAERMRARATAEEARTQAESAGGELVLYEKGVPRNEMSRRLVTKRLSVKLAPGTNPTVAAAAGGVKNLGPAPGAPGWLLFEAGPRAGSALEAAQRLRKVRGVMVAEPLLARQHAKRLSPDDEFFTDQWYLKNTGQGQGLANIDLNVSGVWNSFTGTGITIGIVDDGLQTFHPDIAPNYRADVSYDFNGRDADPNPPPFTGDDHGTACASLAAAKGQNGLGVCGVAYNAKLAALRLISFPTTDAEDAAAFAFRNDAIQIKSNSWGPFDNGVTFESPGPLADAALEDAVQNGRGGFGTIFIWSAGNGARIGDSSPFDGFASQRQVIAVGGLDNLGRKASYSESGANLLCCAPTSGGTLFVSTADRAGEDGYNFTGAFQDYPKLDYTKYFGGTSASAPMVAGVVALMLQARPSLNWRDVKEILITTARRNLGAATVWTLNGAGFRFNDGFGAGLVDAQAAVTLAQTFVSLPAETSTEQEQANLVNLIPDNKETGITRTFVFTDARLRVEEVLIDLDILHSKRGQVEVTLQSPFGTKVKMMPTRLTDKSAHYQGARFTTPQFWGEMAAGTWTVTVADRKKGTVGTLQRVRLQLYGSSRLGHASPAENGLRITADSNSDLTAGAGEQVTADIDVLNDGATKFTELKATLLATGGVTNPTPTPVTIGEVLPGAKGTGSFSFSNSALLGETVQVTLELKDGDTSLGTVTYPLTLGHLVTITVSNPAPIAIPSFSKNVGNAAPYGPAVRVNLPVATAKVTKVVLHLEHLNLGRSADIDMLLVSPTGTGMIPMSDVGGEFADDINLTIDDYADVSLPLSALLFNGRYRPANYGATVDSFPKPAPVRPYGANFAVFNGEDPQGDWKLFIRDDAAKQFGALGSWSLEITYAY